MIGSLFLTNAQSSQRVRLGVLRQITKTLVRDLLNRPAFELGIVLVSAREITRLNETFLRHQGPTDVIAFDYALYPAGDMLRGEIFLCVQEAQRQAPRFRTSWQQELVRYLIHGILHLCGYRDDSPPARLKMKQTEDRCLHRLSRLFTLDALAGPKLLNHPRNSG